MAGYKHKKTELWHEMAPAHDRGYGWDKATKTFTPVPSYVRLCSEPSLRHLPPSAAFVSEFTAAMESGQLDDTNWFTAFADLDDWRLLASDLVALEQETGGPLWINERERYAFMLVFEAGAQGAGDYMPHSTLDSLGDLGIGLRNADWSKVRQLLPSDSGAKHPRLTLVKAS
jgi:hypothetical protein